MMKASEFFDLPVAAGGLNYNGDDLFGADGSGIWHATFCSQEQAQIAANCINHADALADSLESMLEHEKEMAYSAWDYRDGRAAIFEQSEEFARFNDSFADELSALAAYRGVK